MKMNTLKTILAAVLIMTLCSATVFAADVPTDVKGLDCEAAVKALMDEGIITGDTDGLFHPEDNLSRSQICLMITKAIDADILNDKAYTEAADTFSDLSGYGWAKSAINYANGERIAKGYTDGTFKPGANVTLAELLTFTIRACGYTDYDLAGEWPANYITKAEEMNLLTISQGKLSDNVSYLKNTSATKAQAATVLYNALETIKNEHKEAPVDSDGFIYDSVKFNSETTQINGIDLASNVKIYAYGITSQYVKDMKAPATSTLTAQPLIKYKNVTTKGLYKTEAGKVTEIIVPSDCGFSGKAYCVINATNASFNYEEDKVQAMETLTTGQEIIWMCKPDVAALDAAELKVAISNGDLFELTLSKGQVTKYSHDITAMSGKYHVELGVAEGAKGAWQEVTDKYADKNLMALGDSNVVAYNAKAVVYLLNDDATEYEISSLSTIKKGYSVRMYDFTDDDDDSANIIVAVKEVK